MSDMGGVVDAKTDGDRHEDGEESVDGETPEVGVARHVDHGQGDGYEDDEGGG